jgi:hypothetical protein
VTPFGYVTISIAGLGGPCQGLPGPQPRELLDRGGVCAGHGQAAVARVLIAEAPCGVCAVAGRDRGEGGIDVGLVV